MNQLTMYDGAKARAWGPRSERYGLDRNYMKDEERGPAIPLCCGRQARYPKFRTSWVRRVASIPAGSTDLIASMRFASMAAPES